MGCTQSSPLSPAAIPFSSPWKALLSFSDAKKKYVDDGTLVKNCSPEMLELRILLDDSVAISCLQNYAVAKDQSERSTELTSLMDFWIDLQDSESKELSYSILSPRRASLNKIFEKYKTMLSYSNNADYIIAKKLFEEMGAGGQANVVSYSIQSMRDGCIALQRCCIALICEFLFIPFLSTFNYEDMSMKLKTSYNWVSSNDFHYTNKLAEGGFGIVLQCIKKTTGQEYAMKVQPKVGLLRHFKKDPYKVLLELTAYSRFDHPYVVTAEYAFQTDTLVMLAMPIAHCSDLRRSLSLCVSGSMGFDRVQFYVAEIASALVYFHSHGILYRDLKPANVLLHTDGHIRLADFGSLAGLL